MAARITVQAHVKTSHAVFDLKSIQNYQNSFNFHHLELPTLSSWTSNQLNLGSLKAKGVQTGNVLPIVARPWGFNHWAPQSTDPNTKTSWW